MRGSQNPLKPLSTLKNGGSNPKTRGSHLKTQVSSKNIQTVSTVCNFDRDTESLVSLFLLPSNNMIQSKLSPCWIYTIFHVFIATIQRVCCAQSDTLRSFCYYDPPF